VTGLPLHGPRRQRRAGAPLPVPRRWLGSGRLVGGQRRVAPHAVHPDHHPRPAGVAARRAARGDAAAYRERRRQLDAAPPTTRRRHPCSTPHQPDTRPTPSRFPGRQRPARAPTPITSSDAGVPPIHPRGIAPGISAARPLRVTANTRSRHPCHSGAACPAPQSRHTPA
jgi:hypothetical protein